MQEELNPDPDIRAASVDDIGDPEALPEGSTVDEKRKYAEKVINYSAEMLDVFKRSNQEGEDLWIDFTSTFREHTIPHIPKGAMKEWVDLLIRGNVFVKKQRGFPRARGLLDCLQRERHIPIGTSSSAEPIPLRIPIAPPAHHVPEEESTNNENSGITIPCQSNVEENTRQEDTTQHGENDGGISFPADTAVHYQDAQHMEDERNREENNRPPKSSGITGLMRAYQGRKQFSGAFDEDLNSSLELYDIMSRMCNLSEGEKAEGIPVMLKDDALNFFMTTTKQGDSYEAISQRFIDHYMTPEQRNRTLILWQSIRLSSEMRDNPEQSELQVFRKVVTRLSQLQRQLTESYRKDEFLRDQIIIASDTGQIQQSMRERVPKTSADAQNRIATFLSSEKSSAGSFATTHGDDLAHFTIGNQFGGEARKNMKGFQKRRSLSRWLAGHKGCFVCNKNHRARDYHSKEDVSTAINKLKKKYPKAMVSIDDLIMVVHEMGAMDGHDDGGASDEDEGSSGSSCGEGEHEVSYAECGERSDVLVEMHLANAAFVHGRTFSEDLKSDISAMYTDLARGETNTFQGLFIDTCANRSSVMSYSQYRIYCTEFQVPLRIEKSEVRPLKGIGGRSKPIGTANIPVPFRDLNLVIDIRFQIVKDNVPSLLCMKDMLDNGLDISILDCEIRYKHLAQPLELRNYFLIHKWKRGDMAFSLYTECELKKLHRTFGHPSVSALTNVLKRARPEEMNKSVQDNLMEIAKSCVTCTVHASRPKRFKLTVGTDDLRFNHTVAVDIMYISKRPILHVVDEATHFAAAQFLKKVSSEKVWKALTRCWSQIYLGPPDFLRVDQGSQFISKEFIDSADADGITVLQAPIESPSTMSHVERYHGPLRSAYVKIRSSLPRSDTDAECLQMAVKSVNDTIGPEGLCPTLLVYGAIPRPARRTPADTQLARARAIEEGMKAVRKEQAKRRVSFGLKTVGGPKGIDQSAELRKLPAGSPVLVYRTNSKRWEGPFPFITIDGETVTVQLPSGRKIFRSNVVKPMVESKMDDTGQIPSENSTVNIAYKAESMQNEDTHSAMLAYACLQLALLADLDDEHGVFETVEMTPTDDHDFVEARKKELQGLIDGKTFKVVDVSSVPEGTRIFGSKWVDALKTVDDKTFEKSRLVAQNYRDEGATTISTKSPTVSRLGMRIAVALAAMFPLHSPYLRDISQAYTQSETFIERPIYLKPPKEMDLPARKVLQVIRPLYGIPESGLHWFLTYIRHHKERLSMKATKFDPCVLYKRDETGLIGLTTLQVDDSYGIGTHEFLDDEARQASNFKSKPRTVMKPGDQSDFNGSTIKLSTGNVHELIQSGKLRSMKSAETQPEFVSTRAKAQYIGCCTRPDICAAVQLLASNTEDPSSSNYKSLRDVVDRCHSTADQGLRFVPLDTETLRLVLFTDASFANAGNMKSQIGFVLVLADGNNRANIIHYGSSRCKRVTRSVMAAEVHALIFGFDNAFVAKQMLQEILGKDIPIDGIVDSRTLFNIVAKNSSTLEKRLQIDVHALRESHDKGELRYLAWAPGVENVADGLTKGLVKDSHPLWKLMTTNKLDVTPQGWIEGSRFQKERDEI